MDLTESRETCQWKTGLKFEKFNSKKTVTLILSPLIQTLKNVSNALQAVHPSLQFKIGGLFCMIFFKLQLGVL